MGVEGGSLRFAMEVEPWRFLKRSAYEQEEDLLEFAIIESCLFLVVVDDNKKDHGRWQRGS